MIFEEDASSFDLGEDFLAHYGVKGMHWGIRKDQIRAKASSEKNPFSTSNPNFVRNRDIAVAGAGAAAAAAVMPIGGPIGTTIVGIGAGFVKGAVHDISMGQVRMSQLQFLNEQIYRIA